MMGELNEKLKDPMYATKVALAGVEIELTDLRAEVNYYKGLYADASRARDKHYEAYKAMRIDRDSVLAERNNPKGA